MHQVLAINFDEQSETAFMSAYMHLQAAGFIPASFDLKLLVPHIALCSFQPVEVSEDLLELSFAHQPKFAITCSHLGVFYQDMPHCILYQGVTVSDDLFRLHQQSYEAMSKHTKQIYPFTKPGRMVFHSTLAHAIPRDRIGDALSFAMTLKLPKQIFAERISLTEYSNVQAPTERLSLTLAS